MNRLIVSLIALLPVFYAGHIKLSTNCREKDKQYKVKSVSKKKNNVVVVYAERNDSVFKIVSLYSGKKYVDKSKRLKKGKLFSANLVSRRSTIEEAFNIKMLPSLEVTYFVFNDVPIRIVELKKNVTDIYFSDDIDGMYLK